MHDRIYEKIHRAIIACEFEPGQKLPEEVSAERFGISCSLVRAALFRLERENLIVEVAQRGYIVDLVSIPDVEEMFDFHIWITSACAARAARSNNTAVQVLERFRGNPNYGTREDISLENNRAFHFAVADLCENSRLSALERSLVEQCNRLTRISLRELQNDAVADTLREHNAIIDAIQAHDAESASRLIGLHVKREQSLILSALRVSAQLPWLREQIVGQDADGLT